MTITHVRRIDSVLQAFPTSDPGWTSVLASWMKEDGAVEDEQQLADALREIVPQIEEQPIKPWILRGAQGVMFVPATDFANHFEDVNATEVMDEVWAERATHPAKGYNAEHDDAKGLGHLITQAAERLAGLSADMTDIDIRTGLIKATSALVAAVDLIDRQASQDRHIPALYTQDRLDIIAADYETQWLARVTGFLDELQDLAGQAADEEDSSTPEEAIGWAEERYKQAFGITETTNPEKE